MTTFEHNGCEWYVNDTRGYLDAGPACDECGACECECPWCATGPDKCHTGECCTKQSENLALHDGSECIGLSVAYVCLDGGDALCEACAEKEGLPICV